jgi:hypothetical protein
MKADDEGRPLRLPSGQEKRSLENSWRTEDTEGGCMPRYTVTITRTLTLTTSVSVTAKDEDAAHQRVEEMIEDSQFGSIAWEIKDCRARVDDWQEEGDELDIESVEN